MRTEKYLMYFDFVQAIISRMNERYEIINNTGKLIIIILIAFLIHILFDLPFSNCLFIVLVELPQSQTAPKKPINILLYVAIGLSVLLLIAILWLIKLKLSYRYVKL